MKYKGIKFNKNIRHNFGGSNKGMNTVIVFDGVQFFGSDIKNIPHLIHIPPSEHCIIPKGTPIVEAPWRLGNDCGSDSGVARYKVTDVNAYNKGFQECWKQKTYHY